MNPTHVHQIIFKISMEGLSRKESYDFNKLQKQFMYDLKGLAKSHPHAGHLLYARTLDLMSLSMDATMDSPEK